jgi:hypothetical protein
MHEIRLTLQFMPHDLVRVGLGPDRTVYVPIRKEKERTDQLNRHCESLWSSELAEIFIAAYPDHIELMLAIRAPVDRPNERSCQRNGAFHGLEQEVDGSVFHPGRQKTGPERRNGEE